MFTKASLQKAIQNFDLLTRPYEVICHPDELEQIKATLGEDKYLILSHPAIEKGKLLLVDRAKANNMLESQEYEYKE